MDANDGAPGRLRRAAAGALAVGLCAGAAAAAELTEAQVKAAYIYNFAKFVQWPAEVFAAPDAPMVLCATTKVSLEGALSAIEGKQVQGRELRVKREVRSDDFKQCHILFIPAADARPAAEMLRKAGAMPVLTIGEPDGFAATGGIIGFVPHDERVRFEINPEAANRARLKISSQLLRLATLVQDHKGAP